MTSESISLSVAISTNPGIKHWSLFIEGNNEDEKITIQILGARYRYFLSIVTRSDARHSASLVELVALCCIDVSKVESIQRIADNLVIRNDTTDYSCQDFVLELLDALEDEAIIDRGNADYARNKEILQQKRESWQ